MFSPITNHKKTEQLSNNELADAISASKQVFELALYGLLNREYQAEDPGAIYWIADYHFNLVSELVKRTSNL